MHDPKEPHLTAMKRILRYVQGTLEVFIFTGPRLMTSQSILMLIGLVVPTLVAPRLATVCSWVTI